MAIVVQSSKFFENKACEFYPCHNVRDLNCLFCFCPLYHLNCEQYGGNPIYLKGEENLIKECSMCILPHKPENYEMLMELLK
jgi:Zn-finger protein